MPGSVASPPLRPSLVTAPDAGRLAKYRQGASRPRSRYRNRSRAVPAATDGRAAGPVLLSRTGGRMSRDATARLLSRVVRASGVTSPASPHTLRRAFCTAGLISASRCEDAVRNASRRRPHDHAPRHGAGQPRPTRRPHCGRPSGQHGLRLKQAAILAAESCGQRRSSGRPAPVLVSHNRLRREHNLACYSSLRAGAWAGPLASGALGSTTDSGRTTGSPRRAEGS